MDALQLGPFVISSERFIALLGLGLFVLVAEVLARRTPSEASSHDLSAWAGNTVWVLLLGSRLGFVLNHLNVYLAQPLSALYFWQGGFAPLWGVLAAAVYSFWYARKKQLQLKSILLPALTGLLVWTLALVVTSNRFRTVEPVALPELTLESLYTPAVNLASFTGQPVVVNIWATWCGPCARELPMLSEVAATSEVPFLLIDQLESREKVASYLSQRGLEPRYVLLDTRGELAEVFRVKGTPTTLFFDSDGSLSKRHVGELSRALLGDYLAALR